MGVSGVGWAGGGKLFSILCVCACVRACVAGLYVFECLFACCMCACGYVVSDHMSGASKACQELVKHVSS